MLRITSFLLLTTLTIQISAVLNIPKPIYGVPDGIRYPPPPPDIPPPRPVYGVPDGNRYPQPQAEYGVPILKYGPPKVHFDHGISGPGQHQFPKKFPYQNGGHSKKPSFFDQIKSHFGLSGGSPQYGVPAPNFRPNQHFEHSVHHFESHGGSGFGGGKIPGPAYGVPSHSYGPPQQSYGPPQQSYGPPPQAYGVPHKHHGPSFGGQGGGSFGGGSFGGGSFGGGSLGGGHGSFVGGNGGHHSGPSFAPPRLVPCDGWKPIAGPIGNDDGGHINIQSHSIHLDHEADHADIITHAGFGGSDFNVIKSQGIELHDNSIGTDSFNIPPSGSYGVPSVGGSLGHSSGGSFSGGFGSSGSGGSFGSSGSGGSFGSSGRGSFGNSGSVLGGSYGTPISGPARQPSGSYIPSAGIQTIQLSPVSNPYVPPRLTTSYGPPPSGHYLTPPSGSYGVPQGGNNGGLAISHGSVSGNLKSWPVSGAAPVEPISFKEPLPQGLIESIGESVKQIDSLSNSVASAYTSNSGVQIQQSTDLSSGLYSLPLENSPRPFYQAHELPQFGRQLPLESNFNGHTDCNHGPIQDSYGPPPSGRSIQNQNLGAGSDINLVSSYGPPPSGFVDSSASSSSIQQDSVAHATQLRSSSDNSDDEDEESKSEENDVISSETAKSQQTDNFVIPVQGQLGSYQLQFQSANGLGGETSNRVPHQQLLSEGLLQQILSAIEQPNQSNIIVPQSTYDQHSNHQDVAAFLHSPTGRDTLAEPKKSK